jgi:hypothetical protein
MNTQGETGAETRELEQLLGELLAEDRLPSYIKSAHYELSTDQYGSPMVRIYLTITPETDQLLSKDKGKREEYSAFKQDLARQILQLESGYFPFIRLVEAA